MRDGQTARRAECVGGGAVIEQDRVLAQVHAHAVWYWLGGVDAAEEQLLPASQPLLSWPPPLFKYQGLGHTLNPHAHAKPCAFCTGLYTICHLGVAEGAVPHGTGPWERVISVCNFNAEGLSKDPFKEMSRYKAVLLAAKAANISVGS